MKNYLQKNLLAFIALMLCASISFGQNLIKNGDFGGDASWDTMNMKAGFVIPNIDFNYTDDNPSAGDKACVRISTPEETTISHIALYQTGIALKADTDYQFSAAFKDLLDGANNIWVELILTKNEIGSDGWDAKNDILLKFDYGNNKEGECLDKAYSYDGSIQENACIFGATIVADNDGNFTVPSDGGGDYNLAFKIGQWYKPDGTGGSGEFDITIDRVCIVESGKECFAPEVGLFASKTKSISVYPNPVNNELNVENASEYTSISIVNLLGQNLITIDDITNNVQINTSELNSGVYFIKGTLQNGDIASSRFIKK